jgi:NHLM bacteriocin system ABC transporter ATP-binding protein
MTVATANEPLTGPVRSIRGNEPIVLDDPKTIWLVEAGTVAVFALPMSQTAASGGRRFLFSAESGEALFGSAPASDDNYQLLAVAIGEAEVRQLDWADVASGLSASNRPLTEWVDRWVSQLATVLLPLAALQPNAEVDDSPRRSLSNGEIYSPPPTTLRWVTIQQGTAHWLGLDELGMNAASGPYPLCEGLFLVADQPVQLTAVPTEAVGSQLMQAGLAQLYRGALQGLQITIQQALKREGQRLRSQQQLNQQVTQTAFHQLASTLGAEETEFLAHNEPLLVAMGAVGRALGVTIRPPAASMDLRQTRSPVDAIARASRLRLRQVLLRGNWWEKDCGPLLGFTEAEEQPVALLPSGSGHYSLFEGDTHRTSPLHSQAVPAIAPVAYMFYRPLPERVLKAIDVIQFALKGRSRDLITILLTGLGVTLLGMVTPQATAILMDNAIPDGDRVLLLQIGLGLLVAALGVATVQFTQGLALLRLETLSDAVTQAAVWNRLLTLPVAFFRQYTTGDLQSRVTSISAIRRQLGGNTLISLLGSIFACLNLVLLLVYSPKLALIAVAAALVAAAVTAVSGLVLVRKTQPLLELQGAIFGHTVQLISGISKLRVAGAEERAFATWGQRYSRQVKLDLSTDYIEDIVALFNTLMPTVTSAALFWFTVQMLTEQPGAAGVGLSVGTFLAFNSAFGTFIGGATGLSNTLTNALQLVPQWKRAQPILEAVPEVDLTKADPGQLTGQIEADHLVFRYQDDGPLILNDVSLTIQPGEFIALVGGSGSGKSTLLRLLLAFERPLSGSILFDGQDLAGLDLDAVRRQLGVVLQSGRIMSGSIFDNLSSGAPITLEEAWAAARMAGMADDIEAMPMKMHTVISEGGGNLSGGQRQRLLIARALVREPRIILFDEATSALDNRTQAIVSESLDRLKATRIVIAHRLSTIRNADRIYVLDSGQLIQQGTFAELAAQPGLFAQLMQRQMA